MRWDGMVVAFEMSSCRQGSNTRVSEVWLCVINYSSWKTLMFM